MQNIYLEFVEIPPNTNQNPVDISKFYADYDLTDEEKGDEQEDQEEENYESLTVKQLMRIRDYYNIPKSKKKEDLINDIVEFESNIENVEIVMRRTKLWGYITELKTDKYMKQFIFWS
jgi:hypothetical protein